MYTWDSKLHLPSSFSLFSWPGPSSSPVDSPQGAPSPTSLSDTETTQASTHAAKETANAAAAVFTLLGSLKSINPHDSFQGENEAEHN